MPEIDDPNQKQTKSKNKKLNYATCFVDSCYAYSDIFTPAINYDPGQLDTLQRGTFVTIYGFI